MKTNVKKSYKIGNTTILNDNNWPLSYKFPKLDYNFLDENIKVPLDFNCGIEAIDEYGQHIWTSKINKDFEVKFETKTWVREDIFAPHYYGFLKCYFPQFQYEDPEFGLVITTNWDVKLPSSLSIELTRVLTERDIQMNKDRWNGWEIKSHVSAFLSMKDVEQRAKEMFVAIFANGWILEI